MITNTELSILRAYRDGRQDLVVGQAVTIYRLHDLGYLRCCNGNISLTPDAVLILEQPQSR